MTPEPAAKSAGCGSYSCTIHEIAAKTSTSVRHVYWLREKLRRRFSAPTNEVILSYARAEGFVT